MPGKLQGGACATALPSGVWGHSPARSRPTTPVGKRFVPKAPRGVPTYGRRPTGAVTCTEDAGPPQSAGGRNSADSENLKGTHDIAPSGIRGKIDPSFVPAGFRAALPTNNPSGRPFPGASLGAHPWATTPRLWMHPSPGTALGLPGAAATLVLLGSSRGRVRGRPHQTTLLRWDRALCL